jgi:DNA polymerase-3 subunit alpha
LLKQEIETQESVDKLVSLGMKLEGLYRHASTHAAGVVIADRPLNELVPLYRDPKSDLLVVQYSMKYAEEAGLVKFDFLGLKTLTVLKNTVDMLASRGITVNLETLPFDDKPTYALLTRAETLGVFQFESAGMQMYLKQLKPDCLEDLIALGALYRPGPMENIPLYIARKHGKEKVETLHPMLKEVLEETYGVIIYQEQVQKIAQVLAGYTLGAADLLRRAMGKKIKAEMDAQRAIFVEGAVKNGVNAEQATNIFELVAKFAGYGFNKSHAAAYAVVAYQTAYLKANYPVEFIAASMNYEMHDTDKLSAFAQDAKQLGITLLPPDINRSQSRFCVETLPNGSLAIRYGLSAIRNVGAQAMEALITERTLHSPFASVTEFAERVPANVLNRRQLENLVAAGAFDSISANRRQIFESIDMLISMAALASADRESTQISLFSGPAHPSPTQQVILKPVSDWVALDRLNKEFEAIGFYLSEHPLSAHREITKSLGILQSAEANKKLGANLQRQKLAGVVMDFRIRASARGRFGIVELSDESGHFEVVIYDEHLLSEVHGLLKTGAMLYVEVDAKAEEGRTKRMARVIQLLDEKLQSGRLQSLAMHVSAPADFQQLKKILGAPVVNGAQVHVRVKTSLGTVVIRLKDSFDIAQMQLQQLKEQPHITVKAA